MDKWNLIIDVAKCENCRNCTLAVKDEHCDNDFPGYAAPQPRHGHDWIKINRRVRGSAPMVDVTYLPTTCNHCDNAPCVAAAGDGSVTKRSDGIVIIDPQLARGRRDLVESCPYDAIWWNEELNLPQKWIFDAHLLDNGWKTPRCVQACPTGAMQAVKVSDEEMGNRARQEGLQVLHPELRTLPRVHYRNLSPYTQCFIGGSVVAQVGNVLECVTGAKVSLIHGDKIVAESLSDDYGDFKFDALDPDSGTYQVRISHSVHGDSFAAVELTDGSHFLGKIRIGKSVQAPASGRSAQEVTNSL